MSWLISQALMNSLCSQEQVEEFFQQNNLDGEQSALSNGNHIQQAYCAPDKMTNFSRLSQFGMMFKPLTANRGEELLMSYLEGFHVKTLVQQEKEKALQENDLVCGNTWQESSKKLNQPMFLQKIPLCSLDEDSKLSLKIWPRWGTMRNGVCYQQEPLAQITKEIESGLLPTPTARDYNGHTITQKRPKGFNKVLPNVFKLEFQLHGQCYPHPTFSEELMQWPVGWTDLKPLEMDKSLYVRQPLGNS